MSAIAACLISIIGTHGWEKQDLERNSRGDPFDRSLARRPVGDTCPPDNEMDRVRETILESCPNPERPTEPFTIEGFAVVERTRVEPVVLDAQILGVRLQYRVPVRLRGATGWVLINGMIVAEGDSFDVGLATPLRVLRIEQDRVILGVGDLEIPVSAPGAAFVSR